MSLLSWAAGLFRPTPSPALVIPVLRSRVALIRVQLPADRSMPGLVEAFDSKGASVGGPWPTLAKADPALAGRSGNPGCDWRQPMGETPLGDYVVAARVHVPAALGRLDGLALRPVGGLALESHRGGMMLHGGRAGTATDGSIRVPDEAVAALLSAIPAAPGRASPQIRVEVVEMPRYQKDTVKTYHWASNWYWDGEVNDAIGEIFDFYTDLYVQEALWDVATDAVQVAAYIAQDEMARQNLSDLGVSAPVDAAPAAWAPTPAPVSDGWGAPSGGAYDR